MSFKTFFIFCESAPYTFYDELYEKDNSNLGDFGVAEGKFSTVRSLLKDYVSDENH